MNHTKEPWIVVPGGRHDPEVIITTQHRLDGRRGEICGMDVEFTGPHGDEQKANARRIVACVNACANVTDEMFANGWTALGHSNYCNQLTRQRDELLARIDVVTEVQVISSTYDKVRADRLFAVDDLEYDLFAAGWKEAIASVKGGA